MSSEKITLRSSDGESFEIDEVVAVESQVIKHLIEDECATSDIPVPKVTSKILAKVIEYCKKHNEAVSDDDLENWDAEFVRVDRALLGLIVDQAVLFDLILAANYLEIKSLLHDTCQIVADMIKGKTPEELRKTFNIKNDFTPYEEEEVCRENRCCEIMPSKKITLRSSDGESFEIDEVVAVESQVIKHLIEDECATSGIPVPNVTSKILAKVIEYCKKHNEAVSDDDLKNWDAEFVRVDRALLGLIVDQAVLFDLILAANYLDIKSLLHDTCQIVADMIKGKTPEELRKTFNIKNELTPDEEEEIRRENAWAFE